MEKLEGEVKVAVDKVSLALAKLTGMMKSIFTVQQYDLHKIVTEFERVNIKNFIDDIHTGFTHVCAHKHIDLQLQNNNC